MIRFRRKEKRDQTAEGCDSCSNAAAAPWKLPTPRQTCGNAPNFTLAQCPLVNFAARQGRCRPECPDRSNFVACSADRKNGGLRARLVHFPPFRPVQAIHRAPSQGANPPCDPFLDGPFAGRPSEARPTRPRRKNNAPSYLDVPRPNFSSGKWRGARRQFVLSAELSDLLSYGLPLVLPT